MMPATAPLGTLASRQVFNDCGAFTSELARNRFRWALDPAAAEAYEASLKVCDFGPVVFADVSYDPIEGDRRPDECEAEDRNWIILTLYEKGSAAFNCGGDDVVMKTDEMLLMNGARHCSTQTRERVQCKTMLIPRQFAVQHLGHLDELTAQRVGPKDAAGKLLRSHVGALYETAHLIEQRDRFAVLSATLHLMSLCFHPTGLEGSQYRRSIFRRVEEFMREQFQSASLTPANVASQFGFTPRYLHRLFAETGTTFSEWVRNERLARAERALTNRSFHSLSITQIAHQFGFYDAAHFSNLFKARYGFRPREYRAGSVKGTTPAGGEVACGAGDHQA